MLAITGNAILVATEQQAQCFWGRGHGDSKNLLACLVSLHVCARITDPLWRSHATADCTCTGAWKCQWQKKKLMTEDHKHCLFGLANRMCSVVLFTVAWERAVQRMPSTALVADKIGRLGSLSIFTHYMVHNTGAFCCTLPAESWGPMNQRAFLHKL